MLLFLDLSVGHRTCSMFIVNDSSLFYRCSVISRWTILIGNLKTDVICSSYANMFDFCVEAISKN